MSTSEDAVALINAIAEYEERPGDPRKGRHALNAEEAHTLYFGSWPIERFNDAVTEGEERGWIEPDETLGSHPYASNTICLTFAGRRQAVLVPRPSHTGGGSGVQTTTAPGAKTVERLVELRTSLAQMPPYPWEPVTRWIAAAEPFFEIALKEHLEGFHRRARTPQWTMLPRMSARDRRTGEVRDNSTGVATLEEESNRKAASDAHANLLTFVDSVLRLAQDAQASSTTPGHEAIEKKRLGMATPDRSKVFIIHGRNLEAAKQMGVFLRSLGLHPINFRDLRASMGGTPTVAEIVERGMADAQGVIALFTADEFAGLRPNFREKHDRDEDIMRWQARPNVIFEAGMAFGRDRSRVVFVLLGDPKLFTDVAGIHVLRPTNDPRGDRATLMNTLANGMKCDVTPHSTDWMTVGDLETCVKQLPEVGVRDPFGDRGTPSE